MILNDLKNFSPEINYFDMSAYFRFDNLSFEEWARINKQAFIHAKYIIERLQESRPSEYGDLHLHGDETSWWVMFGINIVLKLDTMLGSDYSRYFLFDKKLLPLWLELFGLIVTCSGKITLYVKPVQIDSEQTFAKTMIQYKEWKCMFLGVISLIQTRCSSKYNLPTKSLVWDNQDNGDLPTLRISIVNKPASLTDTTSMNAMEKGLL